MTLPHTAKETVEQYIAQNYCGECGGGPLIVERGGGVVSITCDECGFSCSASESEVGQEWQQFMETIEALEPKEQTHFLAGAVKGVVVNAFLFLAGWLFNSLDGGRAGLGR